MTLLMRTGVQCKASVFRWPKGQTRRVLKRDRGTLEFAFCQAFGLVML